MLLQSLKAALVVHVDLPCALHQQGAGGGSKTQEISIRVFYYKRLYTTVSDSQIQADPSNYNSFPFWPQKLPKTFREDAIQLPLAGKWP